jgi:acyl carrier protein
MAKTPVRTAASGKAHPSAAPATSSAKVGPKAGAKGAKPAAPKNGGKPPAKAAAASGKNGAKLAAKNGVKAKADPRPVAAKAKPAKAKAEKPVPAPAPKPGKAKAEKPAPPPPPKPRPVLNPKILHLISEEMAIEEAELTANASFKDDLNLDEIDVAELLMQAEVTFEIHPFNEEDWESCETVGDYVRMVETRMEGKRKKAGKGK